jgi:hypothetical protein
MVGMVSFYLLQMNYITLLHSSKIYIDKNPFFISHPISFKIFSSGAKWMFGYLNEPITEKKFDSTINFGLYGLLKYSVCFSFFFVSLILLFRINIFFTPLAILLFYFCEIHFLFLFPLLIDKTKHPILTSIKATYRTGILKCLITVIPIGIFMTAGLLNLKNPFKNWHLGCLAILIWYKNEIRNRI